MFSLLATDVELARYTKTARKDFVGEGRQYSSNFEKTKSQRKRSIKHRRM